MHPAAPADPRERWGELTNEERDAAYDNNAATINSAALVAARNEASAAFRARGDWRLDLPCGPEPPQKWDIYPAADPQAPVLIFIHGGYWQRNSRELFAIMAQGALARGLTVAMPGYTLAPAATMAQIVAEIRAALDWLAREGAAQGAGGPAIVSGWSAGAHLAALALDHPHVRAGVGISGVYELGPLRDTGLNAALKLTDAEVSHFSPLRLPPTSKPFVIAYAGAELPALIHDSRRLHTIRSAAQAPGWLIPIAGANHFTALDALRGPNGEILGAILALAELVK
ncbi:MAG TPA: alpha/beta hydrolase [Roseiarcus sp.]|nr:alpha/beta hydrolase [Roseiarcus sp.]